MNPIFEIPSKCIAELNDTALRVLVKRLCEAELRRAGLPISAVTAGGHQDARDGGVDVRVDLSDSNKEIGFISRSATIFQVKQTNLTPADIPNEMKPKGILRPAIENLTSRSGAYIIVCGNALLADSALQKHRGAMREAVKDLSGSENLFLDFFDRERVCSWVNDHPGVQLWIRQQLGKPLGGWQPYGNWSAPDEEIDVEYIIDEANRIYDYRSGITEGLSITEGMHRIREKLSRPKQVVRLVGLSGVGKTRLVQALFDERVGADALVQSLAMYVNLGDEYEPSPRDAIRQLIQNNQRAILIVDNCPPSTHDALSKASSALNSTVSLITVEYDVGDDDPEGTEVFILKAESQELIGKLLQISLSRQGRFCKSSVLADRGMVVWGGGIGRGGWPGCWTLRRGSEPRSSASSIWRRCAGRAATPVRTAVDARGGG